MALKRAKRFIANFGLAFTICAFLCLIVAFATPHWLERFPHKRMSKVFVRMGLWEACFNDWTYYKDYLSKHYNGCWWIFHFEYKPVWGWLNPPWFLAIQIMITLGLILQFVTVIMNIMYYVRCLPREKERKHVLSTSVMMWIAFFLIATSVTIFGIKADIDRQWLPNPDSNFLSWSFGFAALSGFFSIFAAMCLSTDYVRIREEEEKATQGPAYAVKATPRF
ncbi:hypothetical protein BgiMline_035150 [Biomphalaria glabrata]|uniref:Uncharacterized protein LOC106072805 n=2 Tax=Biomphalaria TaxID=6525 RepID=A0A9U8EII4_BIOGL|nr:uncharacterized protein LOC106072805 [Biomphalaria glabrata]KAI8736879.1 CAunnamed protein product [Biomphalaria glabrata]KAI8776886.1 CAunnamed protein product [Biomphalaria glabrata]KAK0053913.1 hypothetical protein Bpfe_016657 [Biomphalaria pfeifferi]